MADPDELLDRVAKALLRVRAPGLGKHQWSRRAAATVIELIHEADPMRTPQAPGSPNPGMENNPNKSTTEEKA